MNQYAGHNAQNGDYPCFSALGYAPSQNEHRVLTRSKIQQNTRDQEQREILYPKHVLSFLADSGEIHTSRT